MDALTPPPIEVRTCPDDVPSVPPWFAEGVGLARHSARRGSRATITQPRRPARGRAGPFEVLVFVAILLGYAVSGEPFFDRLVPFAQPFMALFGRNRLPHRSTLSRFLAAI